MFSHRGTAFPAFISPTIGAEVLQETHLVTPGGREGTCFDKGYGGCANLKF